MGWCVRVTIPARRAKREDFNRRKNSRRLRFRPARVPGYKARRHTMLRPARVLTLLLAFAVAANADDAKPKFSGSQSCASSGCHGGGVGRDQFVIYQKKDVHRLASAVLGTPWSQRIATALKIEEPAKSARCTVCHSPLEAVPNDRLAAGAKRDAGVSCESCHGPSEPWLRFHTRLDITHEQRVSAGLRDLKSFYARANACVACHLNIDADLVKATHPEMFFELDGQMTTEPPHYKDTGAWIGPRAWFTGQAIALREMSWKLASKAGADADLPPESKFLPRWKALVWIVKKTDAGAQIPAGEDFAAMQSAADKLARAAAIQQWTRDSTQKLLRSLAALNADFRDSTLDPIELQRRGEVLVLAIDRLWIAMKKDGAAAAPNLDTAFGVLTGVARGRPFDRTKFAAALQQIEVAMELMGRK